MFNHLQQPNLPNLSTVSMNGKRYYITPSGKYYPSVTTVVNILNEKGIAEWRNKVGDYQANIISSQAANLGSRIHSIIEKYINNESDILDTATPQEKLMFGSVYSSLNRINNIYCQEAPLYSDLLKMAGRTDCIAEFDGIPSIIDFKTSRKDKKNTSNHTFCKALLIQSCLKN